MGTGADCQDGHGYMYSSYSAAGKSEALGGRALGVAGGGWEGARLPWAGSGGRDQAHTPVPVSARSICSICSIRPILRNQQRFRSRARATVTLNLEVGALERCSFRGCPTLRAHGSSQLLFSATMT